MKTHFYSQFCFIFFLFFISSRAFGQFGERQIIHEDVPDPAQMTFIESQQLDQMGSNELVYLRGEEYIIFVQEDSSFVQHPTDITNEWDQFLVSDMNDDDLPDFILLKNDSIFIAQNQGGLSFSTPFHIFPSQGIPNLENLFLDILDYDLDGYHDILIRSSSSLYFLKNESNFQFEYQLDSFGGLNRMPLFVDIEKDGDYDIITPWGGVYLNQANVYEFSQELPSASGYIHQAADINGDGYLDFINYTDDLGIIYFYENLKNGTYSNEQKILFTWTNINTDDYFRPQSLSDVKFLDIDEDGDIDVLLSATDRTYIDDTYLSIGWLENINNFGEVNYHHIHRFSQGKFSDMDGDGDMDVLLAASFTRYFTPNGDNIWLKNINFSEGEYVPIVLDEPSFQLGNILDFLPNPDANEEEYDLVSFSEHQLVGMKKDVSGTFRLTPIQTNSRSGSGFGNWTGYSSFIDYADVDNDTYKDIVLLHQGNFSSFAPFFTIISLFTYNPNVHVPLLTSNQIISNYPVRGFDHSLRLANLDSHPDLELLFSSHSLGTDEEPYERARIYNLDSGFTVMAELQEKLYTIGDINGNDRQDILSSEGYFEYNNDSLTLHQGVEGGLFVDLDGDGDEDIIAVADTIFRNEIFDFTQFAESFWYEKLEDGSFSEKQALNLPEAFAKFFFADIDNDGDADYLYIDEEGCFWAENTGNGSFSQGSMISDLTPNIIKAADMDQDGDNDVVIAGNGYIYWFENQSIGSSIANLSINLPIAEALQGDVVKIPIRASAFEGLKSLSFSIHWDPEIASLEKVNQFGLEGLNKHAFDVSLQAEGKLGMTWNRQEGVDLTDDQILFVMRLKVTGDETLSTSIRLRNDPVAIQAQDTSEKSMNVEANSGLLTIKESAVPYRLTLSKNCIKENEPVGTLIGKLFTKDKDDHKGFTYAFANGEGDEDNASFKINGNQLLSAKFFDFEEKSRYSIRVETTDSRGKSLQKSFKIRIINIEENTAPVVNGFIPDQTSAAGEPFEFVLPNNIFSDQDKGDKLTYTTTLSTGESLPAWLSFNAKNMSYTGTPKNSTTLAVRITVTDKQGATASNEFVLTIEDVTSIADEGQNNHYRIYPNPAENYLFIEQPENLQKLTRCRIIDQTGTLIRAWNVRSSSDLKVDVRRLKAGTYFLELIAVGKTLRVQVLKRDL